LVLGALVLAAPDILNVLETLMGVSQYLPEKYGTYFTYIVGILIILLRLVTTTPVGAK
jgi:hypothetical protein